MLVFIGGLVAVLARGAYITWPISGYTTAVAGVGWIVVMMTIWAWDELGL